MIQRLSEYGPKKEQHLHLWWFYQQFISSSSSIHHQFMVSSSPVHHQFVISSSSVHHQVIVSSSSVHHQFIVKLGPKNITQIGLRAEGAKANGQRLIHRSINLTISKFNWSRQLCSQLCSLCSNYSMWSIITNYVPKVNGDIPPSLMVLLKNTFYRLLAKFEPFEPWKRYQTSFLDVTRLLKHIHIIGALHIPLKGKVQKKPKKPSMMDFALHIHTYIKKTIIFPFCP